MQIKVGDPLININIGLNDLGPSGTEVMPAAAKSLLW